MASSRTRPRQRSRSSRPRQLWTCPKCSAQFLVANSYHSCGRFRLDDLFVRAEPHVRVLFERFAAMVREAGDSKLIPQKTRAVFMTRMRFINVQVRRSHLIVGFVLRRRPATGRFEKVETFSPRSHVAYLRIESPEDFDGRLRRLITEAYESGSVISKGSEAETHGLHATGERRLKLQFHGVPADLTATVGHSPPDVLNVSDSGHARSAANSESFKRLH